MQVLSRFFLALLLVAVAQMASAERSDADKARDAARKPAEVIAFAGVKPGMTVVDVMAATGWYTEVLSEAVGPEGTVYAENPQWLVEAMGGRMIQGLEKRLAGDRLPNVIRADNGLTSGLIKPNSVDVALTALNIHDTYYRDGEEATVELMKQVKNVLKPGGVFIVIDHIGNPDGDNAKLHRIPEQIIRDLAVKAGFEIAGEGDMLRHPEDDHTKMVFAKGMRGNTDRFVLKLRKPE